MKETYCYATHHSLDQIRKHLKENVTPDKGSHLTFIGSGNYHYVTKLLLERLNEPFVLVLCDHHVDSMVLPYEGLISCGSWVRNALKTLPDLMQVLFIGIGDEQLAYLKDLDSSKLLYIPTSKLEDEDYIAKVEEKVKPLPVYISIDKDVLSEEYVVTNWDQGVLSPKRLVQLIERNVASRSVLGIDVCGEENTKSRRFVMAQARNNRTNHYFLTWGQKILLEHRPSKS